MYFKLETAAGTKETGPKYPQAHCLTLESAFVLKSNKKVGSAPDLAYELVPRAKLTDVLSQASISATGILCNQRMVTLLNKFKLQDHHLFPCRVYTSKRNKYFWLQCISTKMIRYIDFPNSTFYRVDYGFGTDEQFKLRSYEQYQSKNKKLPLGSWIQAGTIQLSSRYKHDLDLFSIPEIDGRLYISQRLAEALIKKKISGIKIIEATNIEA